MRSRAHNQLPSIVLPSVRNPRGEGNHLRASSGRVRRSGPGRSPLRPYEHNENIVRSCQEFCSSALSARLPAVSTACKDGAGFVSSGYAEKVPISWNRTSQCERPETSIISAFQRIGRQNLPLRRFDPVVPFFAVRRRLSRHFHRRNQYFQGLAAPFPSRRRVRLRRTKPP